MVGFDVDFEKEEPMKKRKNYLCSNWVEKKKIYKKKRIVGERQSKKKKHLYAVAE